MRRSQIKMSITLVIAVLSILCVFTIALLLTSSLLKGISDNAGKTVNHYLPELVRTHQGALKVEQIHRYLDAAYRVQNAAEERSYRLLLQVLVHSFMLDDDDYLISEANNIMFDIRELLYIRHTQRALLEEILDIVDQSDAEVAFVRGVFSSISVKNIREDIMQPPLNQLSVNLSEDDYSEVQYRVRFIIDLNEQLDMLVTDAHQRIAGLANYLTTDAVLRTRQISDEVGKDATLVSFYFSILIAILVFFSLMILITFHKLILRPVQQLVLGLRSIENQGDTTVKLPKMYFKELDLIRHSIEEYSELTHRLQAVNSDLERLSQIDGLTGLANRRMLDTKLNSEVKRSKRYHHPLSILMIDIDHFKKLNDEYGHQVGDQGLKLLAEVLQRFTQRPGELAARFGGEEFVLVLPESNISNAIEMAKMILVESRKIVFPEYPEIKFSVSIGISCFQKGVSDSAELLINHADKALYQAKSAGRDCFRLYD